MLLKKALELERIHFTKKIVKNLLQLVVLNLAILLIAPDASTSIELRV